MRSTNSVGPEGLTTEQVEKIHDEQVRDHYPDCACWRDRDRAIAMAEGTNRLTEFVVGEVVSNCMENSQCSVGAEFIFSRIIYSLVCELSVYEKRLCAESREEFDAIQYEISDMKPWLNRVFARVVANIDQVIRVEQALRKEKGMEPLELKPQGN